MYKPNDSLMSWKSTDPFNIFNVFAKLSLNSISTSISISIEAELVLISVDTATHPPNQKSSEIEQDLIYINSNTSNT